MYNVILNLKRHIRTFPSTTSWPPLHCTYTPHLHIRKCIYTYTHIHTYVYIHIRAVLLLLLTCTMYNLHYFWAADAHSSSATMQNSMSHFFSFSQIVFSSKHLDSSISQSHLILHQRQPLKGQCSVKLKTLFDYSKNHAILQSMVNVIYYKTASLILSCCCCIFAQGSLQQN